MRITVVLLIVFAIITACAPTTGSTSEPGTVSPDSPVTSPPQDDVSTNEPITNPLAPQPDDSKLMRGEVFIEESGLVIRESYPPQISLMISGSLPTPCHQLRAQMYEPDADNKINVDVYTVVDPNLVCTQVLKPFSESINLGTYPGGHYSVWLEGELVGEFDS